MDIKTNLSEVIKQLEVKADGMAKARDNALNELVNNAFRKSAEMLPGGTYLNGTKYTPPPGADIPSLKRYPRKGGKSQPYKGPNTFSSKVPSPRTGEYAEAIKGAADGERTDFRVEISKGVAKVYVTGEQANKILTLERKPTPKGRARAVLRKGLNSVYNMYSRLFKQAFSK